MRIAIVPVTPFQQNCSLLVCTETQRAAVVDPGGDIELIEQALAQTQSRVEKIFLTHGHIDHCGATAELRRRWSVPVEGPHREERFWIDQLPEQGQRFGFEHVDAFEPDRWLEGGDSVSFGAQTLEVRFCPGHTPWHVIFFHRALKLAIVGDVLFQGSIGRTDFPRGDHATLIRSITEQLWPLGDDVRFIPGHGPMSSFGAERRTNPFVGDHVLRRFSQAR